MGFFGGNLCIYPGSQFWDGGALPMHKGRHGAKVNGRHDLLEHLSW